MRKGFIKPVYTGGKAPLFFGERLSGYALCLTETPTVDSDIVDHYDLDYNGKMIKESAKEFHNMENVKWSSPIHNGS